jgi:hypothetical protein
MAKVEKLTHKNKDYIYGYEKKRDFPKRGQESMVFFIKQKTGYKFLAKYHLIYRVLEQDLPFIMFLLDEKLEEYVITEIDKYTLKSRRRKLKRLNQKWN